MLNRYLLAPLAAVLLLAATPRLAQAQTGGVRIGTPGAPDASAALDISSTRKGLLMPRLTQAQRDAIASPASGLVIYQTNNTPGLYTYDGTAWLRLSPADNLGDHTATQPLNLNGQKLTGGGANGLRVRPGGGVAIDTLAGTGQGRLLTVAPDGTLGANAPLYGPLSSLSAVQSGSVQVSLNPTAVAANGHLAYITDAYYSGLRVVDATNPAAPVLRGSVATGGLAQVMAANGTMAYVGNSINKLQVIDASDPDAPVIRGQLTTPSPQGVAVSGNMVCTVNANSNTLSVFDVSDPANPVLRSTVTAGSNPRKVALSGTTAYVTSFYTSSVLVFDLSNPAAPVLRGSVTTDYYPYGIAASGTTCYVLTSTRTLQVIDASDPAAPVLVGSVATNGFIDDLSLSGTTVCVVSFGGNTLELFDVSTPAAPRLISTVATGNQPYKAALSGYLAYSVTNGGLLQVFDFTPPTRSVTVTSDGTLASAPAATLSLSGQRLSISGGNTVTLPTTPGDNLGNHTATQNLNLADKLLVGNGGTAGLAIASDGRVGIGTASPVTQLANSAGNVIGTDGNGVSSEALNWVSTTTGYAAGIGNTNTAANGHGLAVKVASTSAAALDISQGSTLASPGTSLLRVLGNGNVGIGIDNPGQRLDVAGNANINGNTVVAGNVKILGIGNALMFPDGSTLTTAAAANLVGDVTSNGTTTTYNNVVPAALGGAGAVNGILKAGGNGFVRAAVPADFPVLNQSTTGNAATATLASTVTTNAPLSGAIVSSANTTLYNQVVPATKGGAGGVSGLLKADGNGVVSAATPGTDYLTPATVGTGFIQNQSATAQAASFNVSGAATVGGNVGIGTTSAAPATQKLDVRGNVRLGADGNGVGTGQAIEWVGPGVSSDPVGIYRVNPVADQSELRVVVGDVADPNDKFVVGRMNGTSTEGGIPTGTFTPTFSVNAAGQVNVPGLAGTGTRVVAADANGNLTTSTSAGDNLGNHTATQALNLATFPLVGNGGSTGLSVTSGGSAQLPAAAAYTYAAPKTYSITYGINDMLLENMLGNKVRTTDASGGEFVYCTTGSLRIPVRLPQGATITAIKGYARDTDAGNDVVVVLYSMLPTDTGLPAPSQATAGRSSGNPGFTTFTSLLARPTIDNNQAYYLNIEAPTSTSVIGAVRITYTVTQAE